MPETRDVVATSRFYVFGLAASTVVLVFTAVVSVFVESVLAVAILGACAVSTGWGVYRSCYRIDLSDGYLVMRYVYRRRVVRLEQVRGIEVIASVASKVSKFEVSLDDGSHFRVEENKSTRQMMESIVQRRPDVLVIGNIQPRPKVPQPPKTRRDDGFWSGGASR
jgi:hypothetical protein